MEDVKVREMQIFDYKKKIAEAETKLKQQQVRFNLCYLYCCGNLSRRFLLEKRTPYWEGRTLSLLVVCKLHPTAIAA